MSQSTKHAAISLREQLLFFMLLLRISTHLPGLHKRSNQLNQHLATTRDSSLVTLNRHMQEDHSPIFAPLPEFCEARVVDEIAEISPCIFGGPDVNILFPYISQSNI